MTLKDPTSISSTGTHQWCPHVTVATVVEDRGRYLLVEERSGSELVINQPAGHLEPGETLFEAAVRETLEETGWRVELTGLVGLARYDAPNGITYHRTTFAANSLSRDESRELDADIEGTLWLSYEEMCERSGSMRSPLVLKSVVQYREFALLPLGAVYAP